jgi:hypothetical protein
MLSHKNAKDGNLMFSSDVQRTPQQRAQKALLNIIARLGGCGFLIYFVVKILTIPEEAKPDATTATIIGIVFVLVSAVVIFMSVRDLLRGLKDGRFKATTYEAADLAEYLDGRETASSSNTSEAGKPVLDAQKDEDTSPVSEKKENED